MVLYDCTQLLLHSISLSPFKMLLDHGLGCMVYCHLYFSFISWAIFCCSTVLKQQPFLNVSLSSVHCFWSKGKNMYPVKLCSAVSHTNVSYWLRKQQQLWVFTSALLGQFHAMDQWGWTKSVILKLELVQIGLILVYVHVYRFQSVESRVEANLTLPSHPLCAVDFTQRGPRQGEEMQWPMFPITNFLN